MFDIVTLLIYYFMHTISMQSHIRLYNNLVTLHYLESLTVHFLCSDSV